MCLNFLHPNLLTNPKTLIKVNTHISGSVIAKQISGQDKAKSSDKYNKPGVGN